LALLSRVSCNNNIIVSIQATKYLKCEQEEKVFHGLENKESYIANSPVYSAWSRLVLWENNKKSFVKNNKKIIECLRHKFQILLSLFIEFMGWLFCFSAAIRSFLNFLTDEKCFYSKRPNDCFVFVSYVNNLRDCIKVLCRFEDFQ
jgi:hypothetical protein